MSSDEQFVVRNWTSLSMDDLVDQSKKSDTDDYETDDYELLTNINCYFLIPLCVFGFVCNIFAMILFNRPPNIVSGTKIYLHTILWLDMFQFVGTAVLTTSYFCADKEQQLSNFCWFYYGYIGYLLPKFMALVDTAQVWSLTALAVHRYWKISRPIHSSVFDTNKKALKHIFILYVIILFFRFPMFLELALTKDAYFNVSVITENLAITENVTYNIVYYLIFNTLLYNVIPFGILVVMSVLTLKRIIDSHRCDRKSSVGRSISRQGLSPKRKSGEIKATLSICLMTLLFLVFHSLFVYEIVQRFRIYIKNDIPRNLLLISDLNTILSMLNCTLNAFVYIAFINKCKEYFAVKIRSFKEIRIRAARSFSSPSVEYQQDV